MAGLLSFRVAGTRPTKLKADRSSDYRFEEQGGLRLPANPLDGFSTERDLPTFKTNVQARATTHLLAARGCRLC